jgi:hypothetical protein
MVKETKDIFNYDMIKVKKPSMYVSTVSKYVGVNGFTYLR